MGQSRTPRITPQQVIKEAPIQAQSSGPVDLTDQATSLLETEIQTAMGNSVAQDLLKDAAQEEPEDAALLDLVGEVGDGGFASAEPPPPGDGSPPDPNEATGTQTEGAQTLAKASGGTTLAEPVVDKLAPVFGPKITDIKVHTEQPAVEQIDAGAAALGTDVFFAPGQFNPSTPEGLGLIAHELTHAIAPGASAGGGVTLGATDTSAEGEAERVQDAVQQSEATGGPIEAPQITSGGGDPTTIQRGGASVHFKKITFPALGLNSPNLTSLNNPNTKHNDSKKLGGLRNRDSKNLSPGQRKGLQIYAGNFMSDFSQANVPKVIDILGKLPTVDPSGHVSTIGAPGAGIAIQTVLHAIAILELGTEAAALLKASNAKNTEMYEVERHLDNPMGASGKTDFVVANKKGFAEKQTRGGDGDALNTTCTATSGLDPKQQKSINSTANAVSVISKSAGKSIKPLKTQATLTANKSTAKLENKQHGGSATPGQLQYENPNLYKVSPAGLQNHLYNSVEASKNSYTRASELGPTPQGRMHVGAGDHIVQDYYSHTNFIEVALNKYVQSAIANGANTNADLSSTVEPHGDHTDAHDIGSGHASNHKHKHKDPLKNTLSKDARDAARNRFVTRLAGQQEHKGKDKDQLVNAQFVSPVYKAVSVDESGNQRAAITSGTFGSTDTLISLAHMLVPVMPKLHASLKKSVDMLLGLVFKPKPDASWTSIAETLASSGRDGAALRVLIEGLGDAGLRIPVPTGVGFEIGSMPIKIMGVIPTGMSVPVPTGLDLTYSGVALAPALDTFVGAYNKVQTLKRGLAKVAGFIGAAAIAKAIDSSWNAATAKFHKEVQMAMSRWLVELVVRIQSEITKTPKLTPEQLGNIADGNMAEACNGLSLAIHHASESTSMSSRLNEGGDMHDLTVAKDRTGDATDTNADGSVSQEEKDAFIERQRQELERRVGPCKGSGTEQDPWKPITPLPPSHSEISKDHPHHDPGNHVKHQQPPDHNRTIFNQGSTNGTIFGVDKQRGEQYDKQQKQLKKSGEGPRQGDFHYPSPIDHIDKAKNLNTGSATLNKLAKGGSEFLQPAKGLRRKDTNGDGHADNSSSTFYSLGVALAQEAQRHLYKQMEAVWAETTKNPNFRLTGEESANHRDRGMKVGHDEIQKQAAQHQRIERARAKGKTAIEIPPNGDLTLAQITKAHAPALIDTHGGKRYDNTDSRWTELKGANANIPENVKADTNLTLVIPNHTIKFPPGWLVRSNMRHAQTAADAGKRGPALTKMHDLVDLFVSHPDDSTWWQTVVDNYVTANEEEVFGHIKARNKTLANRR